jgi:hypothetical protein
MIDEMPTNSSLVPTPAHAFYPYARVCQGRRLDHGDLRRLERPVRSSRPDQFVPPAGRAPTAGTACRCGPTTEPARRDERREQRRLGARDDLGHGRPAVGRHGQPLRC